MGWKDEIMYIYKYIYMHTVHIKQTIFVGGEQEIPNVFLFLVILVSNKQTIN